MAKQKTYPSLDVTGTQAAVYPSEDALWGVGPPINEPGDQGIQWPGSDNTLAPPPAPASVAEALKTDTFLEEVINGETSNGAYGEEWVNVQQYGPTGYGPYNDQTLFESGHTQITVSNPSSEQGWGVGPARRWAHYPHEELTNPFRNRMVHMRNGSLPWVVSDSILYERTQLAWEQQWNPYKQRSPVNPVVQVPQSVPFVSTVPSYAGGPAPHPGVDVPLDDSMLYGGIY
jgi:hypothetical protein